VQLALEREGITFAPTTRREAEAAVKAAPAAT
jgi:hypothetical protein